MDGLFVELFRHLNENWKTELEAINRQYPFEPLKVKHYSLLSCVVIRMLLLKLLSQLLLLYTVPRENLEADVRGRY